MSEIAEQLKTLDPMYANPSCYWNREEERVAVIFHRDYPGKEVLKIIGESMRVDHLARLIAAEQNKHQTAAQQQGRTMPQDIIARINNDFTYHAPPVETRQKFIDIREKAKELAVLIVNTTPTGREQSSALTRLEEAVFHANAAIARCYPATPGV